MTENTEREGYWYEKTKFSSNHVGLKVHLGIHMREIFPTNNNKRFGVALKTFRTLESAVEWTKKYLAEMVRADMDKVDEPDVGEPDIDAFLLTLPPEQVVWPAQNIERHLDMMSKLP